jgi:N-acetylmuramidase/Putative peptidoglycan binding domain
MLNPEVKSTIITEARKAGIEPAALLAVIEVESAGKFFALVDGRQEPLIRFEGHYFDRRLSEEVRDKARDARLSSPLAGKIANPASQAARWAMLERASAFSRPAALESASWGIGQIMGSHWKSLGYQSVEAFVEIARSGAAGQVELLIRFIEKNGLLPVLNNCDWAAFARRYNGPLYRRNAYDTKLAAAYRRHRDGAIPSSDKPSTAPVIAFGSAGDAVRDLQLTLTALGYPVKPTATFDHATKAALMRFQKASGLAADGVAGPKTAAALAARFSSLPRSQGRLRRVLALIWKLLRWLFS